MKEYFVSLVGSGTPTPSARSFSADLGDTATYEAPGGLLDLGLGRRRQGVRSVDDELEEDVVEGVGARKQRPGLLRHGGLNGILWSEDPVGGVDTW